MHRPSSIQNTFARALLVGFIFLASGYQVLINDHTNNLIPAFKAEIPNFAMNDWYVYSTTHISYPLQEIFSRVILRSNALFSGLFFWHVATLMLLVFSIERWMQLLSEKSGETRTFFSVCMFFVAYLSGVQRGWGGYSLVGTTALSAYTYYPVALLSLHGIVRRNYLACALFLLMSYVIHPGGAPLLCLILSGELLFHNWKLHARGILVVSGAILTVFIAVWSLTSGSDGSIEPKVMNIFFQGRSPHHYLPQFMSLTVHVSAAFILSTAAIGIFLLPESQSKFVLGRLLAIIIVIQITGLFFAMIYFNSFITRLFVFRIFPISHGIGLYY